MSEHRRQQSEVEWKGILNTIASLVSAAGGHGEGNNRVHPTPEDITQALQARVATIREMQEVNHGTWNTASLNCSQVIIGACMNQRVWWLRQAIIDI